MQTFRIEKNTSGKSFAFEIENAYVSVSSIGQILGQVDGVTDIRVRKKFSGNADIHAYFKYHLEEWIVHEPYGDSSRYLIGPVDPEKANVEIEPLEHAFRTYQPSIFRKLVGDIVTLKFLRMR